MPIKIRLNSGDSSAMFTVWDSLEFQQFSFQTSFKPSSLIFDPDNQILKNISEEKPDAFQVSANYPNPFNTSTTINIRLAKEDIIFFDIYNILGQLVYSKQYVLTEGYRTLSWDGKNNKGVALPSGMYFSRVSNNKDSVSGKLLLLK